FPDVFREAKGVDRADQVAPGPESPADQPEAFKRGRCRFYNKFQVKSREILPRPIRAVALVFVEYHDGAADAGRLKVFESVADQGHAGHGDHGLVQGDPAQLETRALAGCDHARGADRAHRKTCLKSRTDRIARSSSQQIGTVSG